jgi:hypothetical protein
MEDARNGYYISVGKPQENRPVTRHRHRWKTNAEMGHHDQ